MATVLPLKVFPGFNAIGIVSNQVREIAVTFNAEGIDALGAVPESAVAWADVGTRVTPGSFLVKVPVRLTSLLGFEPFDGVRKYHQVTVAAVSVNVNAASLALEWPMQIQESGIMQLKDFYGVSGIASDVVSHARAVKADIVASVIMNGYGTGATALTLPQPGFPNGLPLFTDGSTTSSHFSNPLVSGSTRFNNLYLAAGTFQTAFGKSLVDMTQVPHPSKANMTMGLGVTDVIGPTHMLIPFWQTAIQTLSLQTTTSPGNLAGATTNIYSAEALRKAGAEALTTSSGLAPWRFHIAPQLDAHPYVVANPGKHMWVSISQSRKGAAWCELAGPSTTFAPRITLLGDGTEEARTSRMVRLFGDLDAGGAAGLPHFAKMYFET